ncbi:S8 family peptidase [Ideonella sp. 4Y11]|uniref:S8 family peptidase n=1 Tax=Ideonella aquatica TaxID=2824119 RepID=A0A940YIE7_9BURK|nr:S8 family peptidase [Ideonella aquatica]
MPDPNADRRPHLLLTGTGQPQAFKAKGMPVKTAPIPTQDRARHGQALQRDLVGVRPLARQAAEAQRALDLQSGLGLQLEFVSQPDVALAFASLGNERGKNALNHIEVLSVQTEAGVTRANVFVPDGKLAHFEQVVADYLAERRGAKGQHLDHHALVDTIATIRASSLRALWTDAPELFPADPDEALWWEVWLPTRGRPAAVVADFRRLATAVGCEVAEAVARFPERSVLLMRGTVRQLGRSSLTLNCVAELRRAKDTAAFFDAMPVDQQRDWVVDALEHLRAPAAEDEAAPRVCVLDSGVTHAHPLIAPLMESGDAHTIHPAWGVGDNADHGTGLATLASYGDLTEALGSTDPIEVPHRLESVKLVDQAGGNPGDKPHHAALFADAVSQPEVAAPQRARVFTSAVSAEDGREQGRPTAWSAMVDRLAADYDGDGQFPRLFVLAAGNTEDLNVIARYPESLTTSGLRDPAQAWNALTVGAFTRKVDITEPDANGLAPVAPEGGLSPYSTTSATWDSVWPLKPDVVCEGGNAARDDRGATGVNSLHLLAAHHRPVDRLLTPFNATSAASALCAGMAARLMADYPALRPETIRALLVHSADWTDAMKAQFLPPAATKRDHVHLIRHCGWGAPDLERARWSAGHALTLVVEDQLQPYQRPPGQSVATRDMHLHSLPWPKEVLESLPPEAQLELRITLSYFIEPNPSARGTTSKFHYASHQLRFDVRRPLDASSEQFVARVNAAAQRDDDDDPVDSRDPHWVLGERYRHRGSLHQDIWRGSAAELAQRHQIAIYPSKGWWRTRPALERYNLPARYSLVVSIRSPQEDVDLYTPVAQQIAAAAPVAVAVPRG